MFKPAIVSESQFKTEQPVIAESDVKRVFMVLHGFYGNLFFSKFATGAVEKGEDQGIANARKIWAHGLRDFDGETIKSALRASQARHPEFPPSLPQFIALCAANAPRKVYKPAVPEVGMSQAVRSAYARKAREINLRHANNAIAKRVGFFEIEPGLQGLKAAIANAVAAAGGDEVKELLRLDRMFAPRAAA